MRGPEEKGRITPFSRYLYFQNVRDLNADHDRLTVARVLGGPCRVDPDNPWQIIEGRTIHAVLCRL